MKSHHIGNKGAAIHFANEAAKQWRNGNTRIEVINTQTLLSIANSLIAITTLLEEEPDEAPPVTS